MGQTESIPETLHMQLVRHAKVLAEINSLTYEDFKACLDNLNALSRKCIDQSGKQLVFLVKNGTDTSMIWKATVKIACIKVDPNTRQIECYKFLNLKQFLCVFKTFQSHLESLVSSENHRSSRRGSQSPLNESPTIATSFNLSASVFMDLVDKNIDGSTNSLNSPTSSSTHENIDECSICLDRQTEVLLPCTHTFCTPCIEQWNVKNKTCPICLEALDSTDDTWVISDIPGVEEINEEICAEFMNLAKNN
ncbi:RING finger protein 141-like [Teleopsis dalmanni]|uniref:RING finger protein 141-like n=1 Tax=Teleopsis dalmanni TaxID=139649 RepID=UPI0018CD809A|nr:RING finger protein 141-like [Teleopsis dalmanni]